MKVLIFIGLKIAEIGAVFLFFYGGYHLALFYERVWHIFPSLTDERYAWSKWGDVIFASVSAPVVSIGVIVAVTLICLGIYHGIKANWEWAEKIKRRNE